MGLYKIFDESDSLSEVLRKLEIIDNSRNWKIIKEKAIEVGFDIKIYKERKKRYCLHCNKLLKKGQNKFCSRSCSASLNNKKRVLSDETKDKISKTLKKRNNNKTHQKEKIVKSKTGIATKKENVILKPKPKKCLICDNILIKHQKKVCSQGCNSEYQRNRSYEYFKNNPNEFNRGNYTPKNFKNFFLNEQDGVCAICGMVDNWNEKELVFVLDHIDGDASNNRRDNLRLVCPNCDSQLPTFKSKNKNSTRRNYWKEKIINDITNNETNMECVV